MGWPSMCPLSGLSLGAFMIDYLHTCPSKTSDSAGVLGLLDVFGRFRSVQASAIPHVSGELFSPVCGRSTGVPAS
jgi:hypothetical protein